MYCLLTHRAGVELPHVRSKSYAPPLGPAMAVGDYVERIVSAALHLLASVRRTDGLHMIGSSCVVQAPLRNDAERGSILACHATRLSG
jgi:hypothetical protein